MAGIRREHGLEALYQAFERCVGVLSASSLDTDVAVDVCTHIIRCYSVAAQFQVKYVSPPNPLPPVTVSTARGGGTEGQPLPGPGSVPRYLTGRPPKYAWNGPTSPAVVPLPPSRVPVQFRTKEPKIDQNGKIIIK